MLKIIVLFGVVFTINFSSALEYYNSNKQQRYGANSDFLLHEAGGNTNLPKRDYVAPQPQSSSTNSEKRDYVSQFPALGNPTAKPNAGSTPYAQSQTPTSKRDYVAPPRNPPESGKDKSDSQKLPSYSSILQGSTATPGPGNFGTTKLNQPISQSTSKPISSTGPNTPSSSNVGTTKLYQTVTQSTPKVKTTSSTKPISYSSILTGTNKFNPQLASSTVKSTTRQNTGPLVDISSPTPRPGASVLPSTILHNQNKNSQRNDNSPTDVELQTLSEELLRKDTNNAAKYVTVNYQEKTTSFSKEDKAPQPLLTVAPEVWNIPTIQKFTPLLDNYERDTLINEYVTPQERNEEHAFMDAIMSTSVIRHLMTFLKNKGYVSPDPKQQRDFLKQLWFTLYSRGKGKLSSSGFEHVFVSELRNDDVLGLHNWIYFSKEETANRVNYLGYMKYLTFNDKGVVMKLHFNQQGADKPVNSMLIGTSPELEIALYTLCFVTRADNDCKLKLGNKDVEIVTHTFRYRSKNLIGSAYPQI